MAQYKAPVRDARFIINRVLRLSELPGASEASVDIIDAVLEEAGRFAGEVMAPINAIGDAQGCRREADGSVITPEGCIAAYSAFCEAGWSALSQPERFGGQALPETLGMAVHEFMTGANMAFSLYPFLTNGAVDALLAVASPEVIERFVPNMVSGRWTGTMNLTEPHAGTDLGLLRTRAVPNGDGSYAITGAKIFISAGDHDLSENIIHLVLARLPDAPAGTKGISMFVVPKFLIADDGSIGARNALSCGAIEHKMGIRASATCQMNYDGATGWLVGEENKGLAAMFIMMNMARLGVGVQGIGQAEVAYQNGLAYALERRQGRALTGPADPSAPADPLIVHPDVRRMLMDARVLTEGYRALALWSGVLVQQAAHAEDEAARRDAEDLLGLLTPIIKAGGTEAGYRVATDMQQIWGGHGYIVENGMEQFVRDARIALIYEGANGVQAMDLVGRKLGRDGGRAIRAFFALVETECVAVSADERLSGVAEAVRKASGEMQAATLWLAQNAMANPDNAGAAATDYARLGGIVALGLMWLRMGRVAAADLDAGDPDVRFLSGKLAVARYYADRFVAEAGALRRKIATGAASTMAYDFAGLG
ncbi:acyl-CoA dehydrogenase C-terminal domain-containing protein [Novosphingobium colocasiae]|uniref:3-methylmercaptopropionyl-CoA dehydrogenase n=1 Tax=Novosphingobium colocasiae TaxID=1256513 RepID=A0A918PCU1_9SPHN|nr:acyl-CoA dehydrogenase C-terminal domain-containing protein [Novosphingobium colocasiae]GGY97606.1 acyl-CoA dehydrogenase [Novosphingobium colocasiae]